MMMVKIIRETMLAIASALWLAVLVLGPRAATAACVGDCDGDGQVLINEIVASVNIFLGAANLSACQNADQNGDGVVLINEVVAAVNSFLDPTVCLMVAGRTPTPTAPPTATLALSSTPTRTPTPTSPPPTATASATISSNPKATLTNIQTSIFSTTCTDLGCHSSAGQAGNLVLEPSKSYGALVNVRAFNSSAHQAGLVRVKPGDPTNSFLVIKCTGPSAVQGSLMPLGKTALTADQLQLIRDWITQGALP